MRRDAPFTVGEWYHCYNYSIDKRIAFEDVRDYQRFLEILYLANDEFPLRRNDIGTRKFEEVLRMPRGKRIVSIAAFCLMPNHFHLALREVSDGGITTFMRKVGTAYTLYFNARYERHGNLFLKPFQSFHVSLKQYPHLISYIHCIPADLYEPGWRTGHVVDHQFVEEHLAAYPYSSLGAYYGGATPINGILDAEIPPVEGIAPLQKRFREARLYRAETDIL